MFIWYYKPQLGPEPAGAQPALFSTARLMIPKSLSPLKLGRSQDWSRHITKLLLCDLAGTPISTSYNNSYILIATFKAGAPKVEVRNWWTFLINSA